MLMSLIGEHLQHNTDGTNKNGTLLYRRGGDMQVALHAALVAKWRLAVGDDDICIIKQQENKPTDDGTHAHAMVTTQAKQFAGREYKSTSVLENISFEEIINEVDSNLRNFLWKVVYGTPYNINSDQANTASTLTKQARCLYLLSVVLHTANPACTFPLHMILTDIVETFSHSSGLVRMLSRVGAIAGRVSHARYRMTMITIANSRAYVAKCC